MEFYLVGSNDTTVMRYGKGSSGMMGITFNDKALDRWAKSLHISSLVENSLADLENDSRNNDVTKHKEENPSRINSDAADRVKIRNNFTTCLDPLSIEENPEFIINIHTGKLSAKEVNVDKCVSLGAEIVNHFINNLPDGFYQTLSKKVVTMKSLQKPVKCGDVEVIDTSLIYSRVVALQLTSEAMKIEKVLTYELAPIQTSIFGENGLLKPASCTSFNRQQSCCTNFPHPKFYSNRRVCDILYCQLVNKWFSARLCG